MAKLTSEREMACPCCGAVLTVDLNLGRIVSHEAPPNPDRPELDNAQRILAEQAAKRDALFEQSFQNEKNKGDALVEAIRRSAEGSEEGTGLQTAARLRSRLMPDESKRTRTVRVATYNIHRARGLDGRTRLERIASVLASIDADVVALQEVVGASPLKPGQAAELGAALGMGWVMAPTRHLRTALFGNVVLSRFPVAPSRAARPDLENLRAPRRAARRPGDG